MKIAIDFDGVCTDLTFVYEHVVNEFNYLYSPFSISISKPRNGILELVSLLGLFADLSVITSRPDGDRAYIVDWLAKNDLLLFFENIICCNDAAKSELMERHAITLLIDDKPEHLVFSTDDLKGALWGTQTWTELAKEILILLIGGSKIAVKGNPDVVLSDVELATDLGASQVFILTFSDKSKSKIRVCQDYEVKHRVLGALEIAGKNNYKHISRFIATNGLAILKSFIEGKPISSFDQNERPFYVSKVGSALAKLHEIKMEKPLSGFGFSRNETVNCFLVFSADNHNTIVTPDNEIAFIDLEACNTGSRWIDLCWAENLLCENGREIQALLEGYFAIYKENGPTPHEKELAKLNYKLWLTYQLQNGRDVHLGAPQKLRIIDETLSHLWDN